MSEVKEIGNHFVKIQFNISLFAEAIWHLATSIIEDHFLSTIQISITFDSVNKARGIKKKKNVCSIRKDLLEGIILAKIWKDNHSPICTIKTSSVYGFCSMFSFSKQIQQLGSRYWIISYSYQLTKCWKTKKNF